LRFKLILKIFIVISSFSLLYIITPINGNEKINIANFIYGKNILLFYILAISGIGITVLLASVYKHPNRIIILIANGTIIIMVIHRYINSMLYYLIHLNIGMADNSVLIAFLVSIFNIILTTPVIYIVKKYFPFLVGRKLIKIKYCS
jgi:hypothetical protein